MNTEQVHTIPSGEHLTLPEPDPDNITVLTRNLPNKPILPWNHYDSPWHHPDEEEAIQEAENADPSERSDDVEDLCESEKSHPAEQLSEAPE
jgi:hypothetical protein